MKANTKRLASLWTLLATDTELSRYVRLEDIQVFNSRVEAEGLSFLTETLPRLFKAFDLACKQGRLCPVEGFRMVENAAYPEFLRIAWETLFTREGILRWETTAGDTMETKHASVTASVLGPVGRLRNHSLIRCSEQMGAALCIRQLSAVFYKLEVPYSAEKEQDVIDRFIANDVQLASLDLNEGTLMRKRLSTTRCSAMTLLTRAKHILGKLLSGHCPFDIVPKHGSGSSSCRVKPWNRWSSPRYVPILDRSFPYQDYWFAGACHLLDLGHQMADWPHYDELGARVVLVPKDSRGPRLISCEPRENMFIQQGLMAKLYDIVEQHPAINAQVGFTDQTRNQRLACLGSEVGRYATLDLKDASDMVSNMLVERLFPENWVRAFEACRSPFTELPDGRFFRLAKFAPMGSALCFPVEALTFWSLALAAINPSQRFLNRLFRNKLGTLERMCLSVFGDDIIVERPHYEAVIETLECFGLTVNADKSYAEGPFRESCGHDYYQGSLVTPVRVKNPLVGDDDYTCFRAVDILQGIVNRYGEYSPNVLRSCHTLFREWFRLDLPVVPTNRLGRFGTEYFGGKLLLSDPWHDENYTDNAETLHPKRKWRNGKVKQFADRIRHAKTRWSGRHCAKQIRVLHEVAHTFSVDADSWCYVLKSLIQGGPHSQAGQWALAKRCRYKYGWTSY